MPIIDRLQHLYDKQLEIARINELLMVDPSREVTSFLPPDLIAVLRQIAIANQKPRPPERQKSGIEEAGEIDEQRFMGIAEYVLHKDVPSFRQHLSQAATNQLKIFGYYDAGSLHGDGSIVSMLSHDDLFNALAAGDFELAEALARAMGNRDEIERQFDSVLTRSYGYTLKYIVLNDDEQLDRWRPEFEKAIQYKKYSNYQVFLNVFAGLRECDPTRLNEGLQGVVKRHRRLCHKFGQYAETEYELLCIRGIGIANLARHRGIPAQAISPLIPEDLLVVLGS